MRVQPVGESIDCGDTGIERTVGRVGGERHGCLTGRGLHHPELPDEIVTLLIGAPTTLGGGTIVGEPQRWALLLI